MFIYELKALINRLVVDYYNWFIIITYLSMTVSSKSVNTITHIYFNTKVYWLNMEV